MSSRMFFTQLMERFLNQRLQKYRSQSFTQPVIENIYKDINESVFEIFSQCQFDLTEKSKKYIADTLFKGLTVNTEEDMVKNHGLTSNIRPRDLPDNDVTLLMALFEPSTIYDELEEENKRRKR